MPEPRKARLRVGLIGAGMVSAFHLRGWRALAEDVELVAIADHDLARATARAAEFGVPRCWPGLAEMLGAERLDAVDIATPPASHAAGCLRAAEAGVAVLCQKPLAPGFDDARALVDAIGGRVRLMVHENWRFRPHYRQLQRWLAEGRIGRLRRGRLHARSSGLLADSDGRLPALVRQPLLASLPRMMVAETLVHHLDVARWLADAGTVLSATLRRDVPQIAGESAASIALRSGAGVAFEVHGDMADPQATPTLRDELLLAGSAGTITLRGERLCLHGRETVELSLDLDAAYQASYTAALAHFVAALRDGLPFETSADEHLKVLRTVEDVYRAAAVVAHLP